MPRPITCSICLADNQEDIEAWGLKAQRGAISWREGAKEANVYHHTALKRHMEAHYEAPVTAEVVDEFQMALDAAIRELQVAMSSAPPEVKPLYAVAIQNMRVLPDTKGSQQNLISAIKGIHDAVGKRTEQALMMAYAEKMFNEVPAAPPRAALPEAIDV